MIIIKKGQKESIDKMLKRYKKKQRDTRLLKDIKSRREFEKPSTTRRKQIQRAVHKQKISQSKDN